MVRIVLGEDQSAESTRNVLEGGKTVGAGADILQVPGNVQLKLGNRSGLVLKV